jgi:membrane-bound serine protease (ClpP class)
MSGFIAYDICMRTVLWIIAALVGALAFLPWSVARADAPLPPATAPTVQDVAGQPNMATQPGVVGQKAAIISLAGEVDDYNRDELIRQFGQAKALGAKVIILNLDTYGGMLTSGLDISRFIKRQDDVHTIAYVQDKAISAGAMIAMACDEIVMSSSASLGDCAPIIISDQGLETLPPAERAKEEGPVRLDFDESAKRNKHDPLLAAAMVSVEITVHWVQSPPIPGRLAERRFVDDDDYKTLTAQGWKTVPGAPEPVDSATTLLTVDSQEAVLYGLASGNASSAQALASQCGYTVVADLSPGWGDNLVEILGSAAVRGLLLVVLLQCLYIVLHAPGHGVAETIGLGALALMLGVPLLTGYATWWEILLIFAGLGLVSVEIALPGHFLPGIVGGILAFGGLVLTFIPFQPTGVPGFVPQTLHAAERGLFVVISAMLVSFMLWSILARYLPKLPLLNRLVLTATSGGHAPSVARGIALSPEPVTNKPWPLVGSVGRAVSELKPGGSAEFFDEARTDRRIISVVSEAGYVPPGARIEVREVAGNRVVVRPEISIPIDSAV